MNETNPYAPPKAAVDDVTVLEAAPPLWNPNAAASWSLLFSPIFGALLHMKNWTSMGDPVRAQNSKNWAIGSLAYFLVFLLASALAPESKAVDGLGRLFALILLISWYYASGKSQSALVLARYGKDYPRKGWTKPLCLALLAFFGFFVVAVVVGVLFGLAEGAA